MLTAILFVTGAACSGAMMTLLFVLSIGVFAYLLYVLLKPEKF